MFTTCVIEITRIAAFLVWITIGFPNKLPQIVSIGLLKHFLSHFLFRTVNLDVFSQRFLFEASDVAAICIFQTSHCTCAAQCILGEMDCQRYVDEVIYCSAHVRIHYSQLSLDVGLACNYCKHGSEGTYGGHKKNAVLPFGGAFLDSNNRFNSCFPALDGSLMLYQQNLKSHQ